MSFNYIFLLIYGFSLFYKIRKENHFFLKPTFIFLSFYFIFITTPSTVYAFESFSLLNQYWFYFSLTHILPIFSLFVSSNLFTQNYKKLFENYSLSVDKKIFSYYFFIFLFSIFIYFSYVNFTETGLYGVLFDSFHSSIMRENSLKLLDSKLIKYIYSLSRSSVCPVLAYMLIVMIINEKKWYHIIALFFVFFFVLLPGERWPILLLIFSCISSACYAKKIKITFIRLVFLGFSFCMIGTLFSIFREGIDWENFNALAFLHRIFITFFYVLNRIIYVPMQTGLVYFSFAEKYFFWGIQGIEKLAVLFNKDPVSVPNYMYHYYVTENNLKSLPSGTYPTCFVFFYYACFSYISILLSFVCIIALDFIVFIYNKIHPSLLIPVLGAEFGALISLVQSDYTPSLFTHGVLTIPLLAAIISALPTPHFSRTGKT